MMNPTLYTQLLDGRWHWWPYERTARFDSHEHKLTTLRSAFVVHAQNIADWVSAEVAEEFDFKDVSPKFKLPFPAMFVECNVRTADPRPTLAGVLFEKWDLSEEEKECANQRGVEDWVRGTLFTRNPFDQQAYENMAWVAEISHEGRILERGYRIAACVRPEDREEYADAMGSLFVPAICSISFFHCKNVTIKRVEGSCKHPQRFRRVHGFSAPPFHIIEVHKSTKPSVGEPFGPAQGKESCAHFVRAHFADYREGKGLFGKLHGTYFFGFHVRGSGEVLRSEYRPWPPDGRHKKRCIVQSTKGNERRTPDNPQSSGE